MPIYKIELFPEVESDILALDNSARILVFKQLKKIEKSPELGELLSNKAGYELCGCRKIYVDSKRIRIVYRIVDERVIIEVIAIGERNDMSVYQTAAGRLIDK
jgi:mRNA interferase RelE/StbE